MSGDPELQALFDSLDSKNPMDSKSDEELDEFLNDFIGASSGPPKVGS